MGKFNIDEVLRTPKQVMLMIGTWPQRSPTFAYRITGFVTMLISFALAVTALMKVLNDFADLESASFGICCSLAAFHNIVNHYIVFFNLPQFYRILNSLKEPILASHEDRLDVFLQDKVRLCKLCTAILFIACCCTVFLVMLLPILNTETERPLPVPFPFDMKNQHWLTYYSVYGFQCIPTVLLCCSIPCYDGMIFTFIAIAGAQLRIVREKIISATGCASGTSLRLRKRSDSAINDILKECVNHHIAIERYIRLIEDTFTTAFLIQLLVSLVKTCLVGFNFLLLSVTSPDFVRCFFFFLAGLVKLSLYCVPGNEIILQSKKIGDACYMSEWPDCNISVRKTLFIIMERSKRPLTLTAANFAKLSLNTLVSVLKTSFSYFTVLKQVYANSRKA